MVAEGTWLKARERLNQLFYYEGLSAVAEGVGDKRGREGTEREREVRVRY